MKTQKWNNQIYDINNLVITKSLISKYVNDFWIDIVSKLSNQHIYLAIKFKFNDNHLATLGNMQKLNKEDKDFLIQYIMDLISTKSDTYTTIPIINLIFTYGLRKGLAPIKYLIQINPKTHTFYKNKLPIAFKPNEYGLIINRKSNQTTVKLDTKTFVIINSTKIKGKSVNNVEYYKNFNLLFNWTDTLISDNYFIRSIGKSIYHFDHKEMILIKTVKKTRPINKTKIDNSRHSKFITMDLETIMINNIMTPYLLSWYDGLKTKSYFITDYSDFKSLLSQVFNDLKNYNHYSIYFHNFAKFDSYFILKYLPDFGIVDPIIHKDKLITLKLTLPHDNNKTTKLIFKDSYLLLPSSLRNLCQSFNVITQKGIFPYGLMDIHYNGVVPDYKYFNGISINEYNDYKDSYQIWDFKEEAIKYCQIDCISLYQILSQFNHLIYDRFKINIHKFPTIPSLAFKIYRTHYLPKDSIHNIGGSIEKDIRQSYTGGAVDMYVPKPTDNEKVYVYDVNSLYPSQMLNLDMPVGSPTYFEGDIRQIDKTAFGFFHCEITSPENLKHPIIQTHVQTDNGIRTMAPLGQWNDLLFSEEMDNAIKYGYKFKILWGYTFNRANVFKKYVEVLYKLRLEYPKTDPMNYIAKLLLNSLYGRFGMDVHFMINDIFSKIDADKFIDTNPDNVKNIIDLGDYVIIQSQPSLISEEEEETHNVNIAIASAVTSYARIHMSQFKNNSDYKLFYSDTDSIYINKPLGDSLISNTILGQMKLEYICNKAIFLAPKVYGLLTENGQTIIKAKGLTKEALTHLSLEDLSALLTKDHSQCFNQEKWFKNISEGNITIKDTIYTLKCTNNKRSFIYDLNNDLIDTNPYKIDNNKNIFYP